MRFESARDLKQELLDDVVIPFATAASPHAETVRGRRVPGSDLLRGERLAVGARPLEAIPRLQRSVALGITRLGREYHLAVRVQRPALLTSRVVDVIRARSAREADIRFIGRIEKRTPVKVRVPRLLGDDSAPPWYRGNSRPLLIGSSVGHVDVTAGTTGAFVQRGGKTHLLSNNHVLANEDLASKGDPVIQRATLDGGRAPDDRVAILSHWIRLKPRGINRVDAALAELLPDGEFDPVLLRGLLGGADAPLNGVGPEVTEPESLVYKVGRTTGATAGRVTAIAIDNLVVGYDSGNLRFDGQTEVEGAADQPFSDGGDSGSLIVDGGTFAVALLFAGSDSGGSNGLGLTYASPIHNVLSGLKADLLH